MDNYEQYGEGSSRAIRITKAIIWGAILVICYVGGFLVFASGNVYGFGLIQVLVLPMATIMSMISVRRLYRILRPRSALE